MYRKNTDPILNVDLEQVTGYLLCRTANVCQRRIGEAIAELDLTDTQFIFLSVCRFVEQQHGCATQAQVAEKSGMDTMNASSVARRLEGKGYLTRLPHPEDSRAKALNLTKEGKTILKKARQKVQKAAEQFFAGIDEAALKEMMQVLYQQNRSTSD